MVETVIKLNIICRTLMSISWEMEVYVFISLAASIQKGLRGGLSAKLQGAKHYTSLERD